MLPNNNIISILQNTLVNNEYTIKENLDLETLKLDLTNPNTLKLYKINQDLQNINKHVDFLIYKLVHINKLNEAIKSQSTLKN